MRRIISFFLFLLFVQFSYSESTGRYNILIGTYTSSGKSEGIYSYEIDMSKGEFIKKSIAKNIINPSFLSISKDKKYVYSVSETDQGSAAKSFLFDKKNAKLTPLNTSLTEGNGPCYILSTEKHVFTANYGGGSISVFGIKEDGSLTDLKQFIQHSGTSINAERQGAPHVHQVIASPDKKYIVVNDLGTDNVTVYKYNPDSIENVLVPYDTLKVKLGSGPRHATFAKNGKILYLVQEIDGTVSVLGFEKGRLSVIQETSLSLKKNIISRAADIHLSPDEKFLYATNRGTANDITCFSVGKEGKLTFVQQVSTEGNGPRNFAISPDGKYVFVGNQTTDNIVIFARNKKSGMLFDTGKRIVVGSPVCLVFY